MPKNNQNDYLHQDPAYGLNDWHPVVAFARGLLEATEENACFERTKTYVMLDNNLLAQTLIQRLGQMREPRAIPIIEEKLQQLTQNDLAITSPWCPNPIPLELLYLQTLAQIGTPKAKTIIDQYRDNPDKKYLAPELDKIQTATDTQKNVADYSPDFPQILKGIRSINDVQAGGGCDCEYTSQQAKQITDQWRKLKWPGPIEFLSGDGQTTTFKLKNKIYDHIHDHADPFSDFAIFMSSPKVEFPINRRRWADSHTFLFFSHNDGTMYNHEYTWDTQANTITTHFHQHVPLEEVTVNTDGQTVTAANKPIATGVEVRGNVFSKRPNSAVRGIWDNPQKQGKNYYTQRANVLVPAKKLIYFKPLHWPVVNQLGIWLIDPAEKPERFFDKNGNCTDTQAVIDNLLIPLHEPKILAWKLNQYQPTGPDDPYTKRLPKNMWPDLTPVPPVSIMDDHLGAKFAHSHCGHAGWQQNINNGYIHGLDINSNGVIDELDKQTLAQHAGEVYRMNIGDYGYFGYNWLSTGNWARSAGIRSESKAYLFICAYDYGAGYEPDSGTINLTQKIQPGKKLYLEYHHDIPAPPGKDNIKVYLHEKI